ncbi:MAG: hypothetical protein KatS3mg110_3787 [Pirellulaceae bacterium]|nr:MAG: hypothetical protein KatS3mg110_3774 [Pirellulaceae bacterium]GIW95746.1 MAG: hypothetical protein KatS3mg110_3787 [Pirellulaceae bacterium]
MHKGRLPRWVWVVLLVHLALLLYIAWAHSPVENEGEYLPAGICHWKTGIFEPSCRNPPLSRLVGALPVLLLPHKFQPEWAITDSDAKASESLYLEFVTNNDDRMRWLYFAGRLACIPFSLLGAAICYSWARELFGPTAGAVALLLWCFSPEMLANNALIMPDNFAASLGVWAAYRFRQWLREPNWPNSMLAGVSLGWTLLAKATWLFLPVVLPCFWLVTRSYKSGLKGFVYEFSQLCWLCVIALFLINATYGFEGTLQPLGKYQFRSPIFSGISIAEQPEGEPVSKFDMGNRFVNWHLGWVPVPLPRLYVVGIDLQSAAAQQRRDNYLFGGWNKEGWWYYYFAAALVKLPLGIWSLVALAAVLALCSSRFRAGWKEELWLLIPALVMLLLLISQHRISRHFRYVLPIAPFAYISISRVARYPNAYKRTGGALRMGAVASLLSATVVSSLAVYPHSMSYFNEAIGGPGRGYKYLLGSNLDRGQDAYYIDQWQRTHPEVPAAHNRNYSSIGRSLDRDARVLRAGWYLVSAEELLHPKSPFHVLWGMEPKARIAYTTWVFHVPRDMTIRLPEETR